jgi:hypothetical protein
MKNILLAAAFAAFFTQGVGAQAPVPVPNPAPATEQKRQVEPAKDIAEKANEPAKDAAKPAENNQAKPEGK